MRCISSSKISGSVYTSRRTRSGSTHFERSGIRSCSMVDLLGRNDNLTPPQEEACMFRYLVLLLGFCSMAQAQPIPLRVKMFPGAQALPVMAAASPGLFERHGLTVGGLVTLNSQEQRDGLASGDFQIAQDSVGNAG